MPGETLASPNEQREIEARIAALARSANPGCKRHRVVGTEILDLRADVTVVVERWTLEECGKRSSFTVSFSPRSRGKFSVMREP